MASPDDDEKEEEEEAGAQIQVGYGLLSGKSGRKWAMSEGVMTISEPSRIN